MIYLHIIYVDRIIAIIQQKKLFELEFGNMSNRAYRVQTESNSNELVKQFGSFTALLKTTLKCSLHKYYGILSDSQKQLMLTNV